MTLDDRKAAVEGLYGEMEVLLIHLAGLHRSLSMHYKADSIANVEHNRQAIAADLVAEYWAASAAKHLPDLIGDKHDRNETS